MTLTVKRLRILASHRHLSPEIVFFMQRCKNKRTHKLHASVVNCLFELCIPFFRRCAIGLVSNRSLTSGAFHFVLFSFLLSILPFSLNEHEQLHSIFNPPLHCSISSTVCVLGTSASIICAQQLQQNVKFCLFIFKKYLYVVPIEWARSCHQHSDVECICAQRYFSFS